MMAIDTVFKTKTRSLILWGIAGGSDCWKGIFTVLVEAGYLLHLILCHQKLWGLMLSKRDFDQHAHN